MSRNYYIAQQDSTLKATPTADTVHTGPAQTGPASSRKTTMDSTPRTALPVKKITFVPEPIAVEDTLGQALLRQQAIAALPPLEVLPYEGTTNFLYETFGRYSSSHKYEQWWQTSTTPGIQLTEHPLRTSTGNIALAGLLIVFSVLVWSRLWYEKQLRPLISSLFNYQLIHKSWANPNTTHERMSYFLNLNYFLVMGLFTFLVAHLAGANYGGMPPLVFLLVLLIFWVLVYILQRTGFKFFGYLLELPHIFGEYYFHIQYINKSGGLFLVPIVLGLAFVPPGLSMVVLWCGISLVAGLYLLRLSRGLKIFMAAGVLKIHLLLYLCTLEIVPLLVCYKLVRDLM